MIFVTCGSTYAFDRLVKAIDEFAKTTKEEIIIQTGNSKYVPKHCKYFKFEKDLKKYIRKARLVISHGGAGSSYEILSAKKALISVENKEVNDSHQWDLLQQLEKEGYIIWCKNLRNIEEYINQAKKAKLKTYHQPECTIHKEIISFLERSK